MTDYSAHLATGRVPAEPFALLGQMTTADPARSPPGPSRSGPTRTSRTG